ncbi:predicted protein [Nematostella vectensis]|uniref:U3 small nucleolar RNA-associated protein 15 homolog n=1 Tax=Nematostella vectensis TaxID=45351 RepID=A7SWE8_NEMVE|nr:predicted protein [Nematostella vectensis]|eukprot:XP_001624074.1 predicted protein [Nematostella vectensis]
MASEFHKIQVKRYPKVERKQNSDSKYWKKFSSPIFAREYGAVTHVDFCNSKPHDFAVTGSTRVQIYSSTTHQVNKTISRFKEVAYCGTFRSDGQLMIAGGEDGLIQLFDLNSRAVLRQFKGHSGPVHVTKFLQDNLHIVSASDDKLVNCWDIATEQTTATYKEHEDYVRTGVASQVTSDIFLTGSYDHTVRMWDRRCNASVNTLDHGAPVECIQVYPNGAMAITAGENVIKIWDILSGGRLVTSFSNHQKTITSLCFDGAYKRLLSGSIDRNVKVYDLQDYKVVHSMDYPSPILSLAVSPDDSHIVVGMSDGLLSIKHRNNNMEETSTLPPPRPRPGSFKYFIRGQNYKPTEDDVVVSEKRKTYLNKYDKLVKNFEYAAALDAILQPLSNHPPVVVAILQELIRRGGLERALSGRDEEGLVPILYFLIRNITNPRYTVVLIDVANILLDMYSPIIGQSPNIDQLFTSLREGITKELDFSQQACELLGALDTIFAASSCSLGTASMPEVTEGR